MSYTTIRSYASGSFIEKKSEFIGHICPVSTNDEAVDFINKIKSENRKARHNPYAYILRDGNISRYSDDGEPQGTAGVPILDVLIKEGLTDICVVVTRYFGGILLGGGGLVRAYSKGCKLAVDAADKMVMCRCAEITAKCDYSLYGKISYVLPEFQVKLLDSIFENEVTLKMLVKEEFISPLLEKLTDLCGGKIHIEQSDIITADFG